MKDKTDSVNNVDNFRGILHSLQLFQSLFELSISICQNVRISSDELQFGFKESVGWVYGGGCQHAAFTRSMHHR